jgi:hypothetical protein
VQNDNAGIVFFRRIHGIFEHISRIVGQISRIKNSFNPGYHSLPPLSFVSHKNSAAVAYGQLFFAKNKG